MRFRYEPSSEPLHVSTDTVSVNPQHEGKEAVAASTGVELRGVQGYLAHKKQLSLRTLQQDYA